MKAEMSVGNGMGRIASVSRTSGKAGRVAQILTPGAAIVTAPAAMPQPRNAHPVTRQEAGHPFSQRGDDPDNLMARDNRKLVGHYTVDNMEVNPTDNAGGQLDQQFRWSRVWMRAGDKLKRTGHRAQSHTHHNRPRQATLAGESNLLNTR